MDVATQELVSGKLVLVCGSDLGGETRKRLGHGVVSFLWRAVWGKLLFEFCGIGWLWVELVVEAQVGTHH